MVAGNKLAHELACSRSGVNRCKIVLRNMLVLKNPKQQYDTSQYFAPSDKSSALVGIEKRIKNQYFCYLYPSLTNQFHDNTSVNRWGWLGCFGCSAAAGTLQGSPSPPPPTSSSSYGWSQSNPGKRLRAGSRRAALIRHSPEWVLRTINL